jgi:hypothetical protein
MLLRNRLLNNAGYSLKYALNVEEEIQSLPQDAENAEVVR